MEGASPVVNPSTRRGITSFPARHDLPFCQAAGQDSRPFGHQRPAFSLEAMAAGKVAFFALLSGYIPWSCVRVIYLKEGPIPLLTRNQLHPVGPMKRGGTGSPGVRCLFCLTADLPAISQVVAISIRPSPKANLFLV